VWAEKEKKTEEQRTRPNSPGWHRIVQVVGKRKERAEGSEDQDVERRADYKLKKQIPQPVKKTMRRCNFHDEKRGGATERKKKKINVFHMVR